jgi:hypothetical protein
MCACVVNRRAHVRTCGLNNRVMEARLTGVKLVSLMFLIVHVADLGRVYVLQVSVVHDAYWLARVGLVPAARHHGY